MKEFNGAEKGKKSEHDCLDLATGTTHLKISFYRESELTWRMRYYQFSACNTKFQNVINYLLTIKNDQSGTIDLR